MIEGLSGAPTPLLGGIVLPSAANNLLRQGGVASLPWLPKWRAKLAGVQAGTGRATLLITPDSTGAGAGAGSGGTLNENGAYANAWPARLALILAKEYGLPTSDNSVIGTQGVAVAYGTYDPRVTYGTGWSNGVGGNLGSVDFQYTSGSGTGIFAFTPGGAFDNFTIIYLRTSVAGFGGTFTTNIDGGASLGTTDTSGATAVQTVSYTVARGVHTINLTGQNDANSRVIGIKTWDSTTPAIDIMRAAKVGGTADDLNVSANVYSPLNIIQNQIVPDLLLSCLTINNSNNDSNSTPSTLATALAAYRTNTLGFVTVGALSGDNVLMVGPPSDTTPATDGRLDRYIGVLATIAVERNLPLINLKARWGSYAAINSILPYSDTLHPGALAYWDVARAVAQVIARP